MKQCGCQMLLSFNHGCESASWKWLFPTGSGSAATKKLDSTLPSCLTWIFAKIICWKT